MSDVRSLATLALVLASVAPIGAAAQAPIRTERVFERPPPAARCGDRPCPPPRGSGRDLVDWPHVHPRGGPARPAARGGAPPRRLVRWPQVDRRGWTPPAAARREAGPRDAPARRPAPGAFHLVYGGVVDARGVLHGVLVRGALHLHEPLALELTGGVLAGGLDDNHTRIELPLTVGLRVHAPLRRRIARVYGAIATGVLLRTTPARRDTDPTAVWPLQAGAGLELGFPVGSVSLGVVVDGRLDVRVPVSEGDASVGAAWNAGLSLSWF